MPLITDATHTGTQHAHECTLVLTEGDAGAAFVTAGLGVVCRAYFGVYPLYGNFPNVRNAPPDEIQKNSEICNLQKILGLRYNKEYLNTGGLRYGRIMIITDQAGISQSFNTHTILKMYRIQTAFILRDC